MTGKEIVIALQKCNNGKGHRCSECPALGKYNHRICKATIDKLAVNLIERLQSENTRLKAERDSFEYELLAVMHSVDKWLEGKDLKDNPATRAVTAREVALRAIEKVAAERDKAVEDITNIINNYQKYIKERDKNN